jgi:hypothetical protein
MVPYQMSVSILLVELVTCLSLAIGQILLKPFSFGKKIS